MLRIAITSLFMGCVASSFVSAAMLKVNINLGSTVDDANTNTPGQVHGGIAGTSWGLITNADGTVSVDSAGNAINLGIDLGLESSATSNSMNLSLVPNTLGGTSTLLPGSVFANTNARTGVFPTSGTTNNGRTVGVTISGLATGTYDFYVSGRNTNIGDAYPQIVLAGKLTTADITGTTYNYSGFAQSAMTNPALTNPATTNLTWVEGTNFVKMQLTIATNDLVGIIAQGGTNLTGTAANDRGFINTIQIVQVPEPTSLGLLGLGGLAMLRRRR
jgi:hypothetical protein